MSLRSDEYIRGVNEINRRLDKIIELLMLRGSIEQARLELMQGNYVPDPFACICHKKGQTSAIEVCPIHG